MPGASSSSWPILPPAPDEGRRAKRLAILPIALEAVQRIDALFDQQRARWLPYLEPAARDQVRELLAIENATTLASVSTWADQVRPQRRVTAPWHYVDIQIGDATYDPPRDCVGNNCLVAKIGEFAEVLADRSAEPARRLEALKFVVHFVGDPHQPFPVADNHDRGGNEVIVTFSGRKTNLHAVWDTALLAPAVQGDERATRGCVSSWLGGACAYREPHPSWHEKQDQLVVSRADTVAQAHAEQ